MHLENYIPYISQLYFMMIKGDFKTYKALKRRYIYEAHELVDIYELPMYLQERIADCNSQMSIDV